MITSNLKYRIAIFSLVSALFMISCNSSDTNDQEPSATDFTDLLTNQVDERIIPAMVHYRDAVIQMDSDAQSFVQSPDEQSLNQLRISFEEAYIAYQAAAVHNYFATANQSLVTTSNLYPIDTNLLSEFIINESYNFNTSAQLRANGFPALDYLLYQKRNIPAYFSSDPRRGAFLTALVNSLKEKSIVLVDQWTGNLRDQFIDNGGTALGSSISVQLNESIIYYEEHIRENKVGIPIGRLGPNDSPITPDSTKIEALYLAQFTGQDSYSLGLLRAAIQEMEAIFFGTTQLGVNAMGYDDLLAVRGQTSINSDVENIFSNIYEVIDQRIRISGNDELYLAVQELITIYKSDVFPILNVQDADGANDGD